MKTEVLEPKYLSWERQHVCFKYVLNFPRKDAMEIYKVPEGWRLVIDDGGCSFRMYPGGEIKYKDLSIFTQMSLTFRTFEKLKAYVHNYNTRFKETHKGRLPHYLPEFSRELELDQIGEDLIEFF